ncbi:hypothetical protein ALI22I_33730 [Saccharothrix sp. ALI-22-I]|uniref:hypothetical protein n=1 Tax=Saccharothrix sp. ALI-22-I TaxID=1933778 RepID=UPI0009D23646|nr:hypothetical protein [Saccharothrix sp. ALI-22-I]ONI83465.1 hypothetical protein ALI22I_33730 [Saccharothrix sp. ALI-22-I]
MSAELQRALRAVEHAVYEENARGGEARALVMEIGRLVGVDLAKDMIDHTWSPLNMRRVVNAVDAMRRQNAMLRGLPPDGFAPSPLGERIDFRERGW